MKRMISCLLALLMILSLAACGSSYEQNSGKGAETIGVISTASGESTETAAPESTAGAEASAETTPEPEPEPAAVQWDKTEEYEYQYEDVTLLETENIRITASKTDYKTSKESASGMRLLLRLNVENLTDSDIELSCKELSNKNSENGYRYAPDAKEMFWFVSDDWNGMIGETEECCVDSCQITVRATDDKRTVLESVLFDWYVSEQTPFVNVVTGAEAVDQAVDRIRLEKLKSLPSLYHAENELISVDVVKVDAWSSSYSVTYVVTNQSDVGIYADPESGGGYWAAETAYGKGESWVAEKGYQTSTFEDGGTGTLTANACNALHQHVAELALEVTAGDADLSFAVLSSRADPAAAKAYEDITKLEPIFSIENDVARFDMLAVYCEDGVDRYTVNGGPIQEEPYTRGYLVYSLTNLADQDLWLGGTFKPGETLYSRNWFDCTDETSGTDYCNCFIQSAEGEKMEAVRFRSSYDWTADHAAKTVGVSNLTELENRVDESALAGNIRSYYYSGVVLAQTDYYRIELTSMSGEKDSSGRWSVRANFEVINTYGSRYLTFDPGKQGSGYDPGADWFDPEERDFYNFEFVTNEDDLTGEYTMTLKGYSWNGSIATKLFEDSVSFTLRFDKDYPVE